MQLLKVLSLKMELHLTLCFRLFWGVFVLTLCIFITAVYFVLFFKYCSSCCCLLEEQSERFWKWSFHKITVMYLPLPIQHPSTYLSIYLYISIHATSIHISAYLLHIHLTIHLPIYPYIYDLSIYFPWCLHPYSDE